VGDRHVTRSWKIEWAGGFWVLEPGHQIVVLERNDDWMAAHVSFVPAFPAYPTMLEAVVPLADMDCHTEINP
jgi:hypothetical protein